MFEAAKLGASPEQFPNLEAAIAPLSAANSSCPETAYCVQSSSAVSPSVTVTQVANTGMKAGMTGPACLTCGQTTTVATIDTSAAAAATARWRGVDGR
jgi:hypothetical protein